MAPWNGRPGANAPAALPIRRAWAGCCFRRSIYMYHYIEAKQPLLNIYKAGQVDTDQLVLSLSLCFSQGADLQIRLILEHS